MTFRQTAPTAASKSGVLAEFPGVRARLRAKRPHDPGDKAPWHFLDLEPLPQGHPPWHANRTSQLRQNSGRPRRFVAMGDHPTEVTAQNERR